MADGQVRSQVSSCEGGARIPERKQAAGERAKETELSGPNLIDNAAVGCSSRKK